MVTPTQTDASHSYDVIVVGGGPAGLSTALYTIRLGHSTAVIHRGGGRAAMMMDTHNVIGVNEDVTGFEFLQTAIEQLEAYGVDVIHDTVETLTKTETASEQFEVGTGTDQYTADRVVLATGFDDVPPDPPLPRTGRGLHYCLHCDAAMFVNESVYVMGHSDSAANVAMIMLNFNDEVDLLLRGDSPSWNDETDTQLRGHPIDIIDTDIESIEKTDDGWLSAFNFEDGVRREYRGGFAVYGSKYNNGLARDLEASINEDGTVVVDKHGRTTVSGLYAVGDLTPGHNQIPVAMGEGANTGIAIHMELRQYPLSIDELTDKEEPESELPG